MASGAVCAERTPIRTLCVVATEQDRRRLRAESVNDTRRALGSWLEGPPRLSTSYAGQRLGLPEIGRGSVASFGEKLLAIVIDLVVSSIIGFVIVRPHTLGAERVWNGVSVGVFIVVTTFGLMTSGRTIGMRVLALQVVRRDGRTIGPRALIRQLLVALLIPALLANRDRRGLHDRLCNTIVVRVR
jgi:uncharacterized RDD family membrane protein YckC